MNVEPDIGVVAVVVDLDAGDTAADLVDSTGPVGRGEGRWIAAALMPL